MPQHAGPVSRIRGGPRPWDERSVSAALSALFRLPVRGTGISELAGDASTRRYFRVAIGPGSPVPTLVVMHYPEEVAPGEEHPFLNVHRYLEKAGVPVPRIHLHSPEKRLLYLEDAGDTLLEGVVRDTGSPDRFLPLYERSLEILVRIQRAGTRAL